MTYLFPNDNKQFIQSNKSDNLGNTFQTFNCDFASNEGVMRGTERLILNTSNADVPEITGVPVGFRYFNNGTDTSVYTIAGTSNVGYAFKGGNAAGSFSKVSTAGAPTTVDSATSDIEVGFGELYVTSANDAKAYYLNGSNTWASISCGGAGSTMMLCFFNNRMYCTKNGNIIQSWDSTHVPANPGSDYALQLPTGTVITFIKAGANRIWIGTVNIYGGRGSIYEWDGVSHVYTKEYKLKSAGGLSCTIDDDIPHVVDANGNWLKWDGSTFKRIAGFYRRKNKQLYNASYYQNKRFIHPQHGMGLINDELCAHVDLTNNDASLHAGTQEWQNPSGIWALDASTNSLRHRYSLTLTKTGTTITDYGQERIAGAGGFSELIDSLNFFNATFAVGSAFYTDATTVAYGIHYNDFADTLRKTSLITTTWIKSEQDFIEQKWNVADILHRKFDSTSDRMVLKHRVYETDPIEGTINWTTTTSFNTTADLSTIIKGDEVRVIQGIGSGKSAHIIDIKPATGAGGVPAYIVKVDEIFTGVTGTSKARFDKWVRTGDVTDTKDFDILSIIKKSPSHRIQLKLWMLWSGDNEFDGILINNQPHQAI